MAKRQIYTQEWTGVKSVRSNPTKHRAKFCHQCAQASSVLYRVRYEASGQWVFVCELCLLNLRHENPHYVYGGTWKAQKRR